MFLLKISLLIIFAWLIKLISCEECPELPDIITSLPNYLENQPFPCMYSGTINVDEDTDSNLFYWFFRDEKLKEDAPLILWINGGPGASSMIGLFIENGPLKLVRDQNNILKVHYLEGISWTSIANVIFLDQPIGTGYSYGHKIIANDKDVRDQAIEFL